MTTNKEGAGRVNPKNARLLEGYLSSRSLSSSNAKSFGDAMKSYGGQVSCPLEDSTKIEIGEWFNKVRDGILSDITIDLYGQRLRTLHLFAAMKVNEREKAKLLTADAFEVIPFKDLRRQAKHKNHIRDKLVSREDFNKLLAVAKHPRVAATLTMLYESGCRKNELLSLRIKDVVFGENYTEIRVQGKTGERTVPLIWSVPYLRAWLQIHPDRRPEQWLFATTYEGEIRRMSSVSLNTGLLELCRRAGIRKINPHMLRHTRLTDLAIAGLGEYQMKSFAGWTPDSNMAGVYIHLAGRDHIQAVLDAEGLPIHENPKPEPVIPHMNCPQCDSLIGPGMIHCPRCGLILDEKLRADQVDKFAEMRAELEELKEIVLGLGKKS